MSLINKTALVHFTRQKAAALLLLDTNQQAKTHQGQEQFPIHQAGLVYIDEVTDPTF